MMKRIIYIFILIVSFISCKRDWSNQLDTDSTTKLKIPTNGLVAWYPFNGNTNDESGNGNYGTSYGAKMVQDRFGKDNSAYEFNSLSDKIVVQNNNSLALNTNFSVCIWIKPYQFYSGKYQANYILHKGNPAVDRNSYCLSYMDNDPYLLSPETEKFEFYGKDSNLKDYSVKSNAQVLLNITYFIVCTYDSKYLKLYVNEVLENKVDFTLRLSDNGLPLIIGKTEDVNFPYNVKGIIDDIRIYNRALTEQEIQVLYHEGGWGN